MGCGIGLPKISMKGCYRTIYPIRINIDNDFQASKSAKLDGRGRFFTRPLTSKLTLEFDAYYDADLALLRDILYDRYYESKVFLNDPVSNQVFDHNPKSATNWVKYGPSNGLPPGSPTELTTGEYATIGTINTTYFEALSETSYLYSWIILQFDISAFINESGMDAIERMTLFFHNPYSELTISSNPFNRGVRAFAYNRTTGLWTTIGEQNVTITDPSLRAINRINQRYFGLKKASNFSNFSDYINASDNTIQFAICNDVPNVQTLGTTAVGFNYDALIINGFGVKQSAEDNFTYREPWTGSGNVATLIFDEV